METELDRVVQEFSQWRANKKTVKERAPKDLLKRAQSLAPEFTEQEIARRCGIHRHRLFPKPIPCAKDFVEVESGVGGSPASTASITVEFRRAGLVMLVTLPGGANLTELFQALRP